MTYPGEVGHIIIDDDEKAAEYAKTLVTKGVSFKHQTGSRFDNDQVQHIFRVVYN